MSTVRSAEDLFEVKERIKSGSFCTVYRAISRETRQQVALKQYEDADFAITEVALMKKCQHPRLLQLIALFQDQSHKFFAAVEWCDVDLLVYTTALPAAKRPLVAPSFLWQLLQAVEFLHRLGFVHADVKPDNIMLRRKNDLLSVCLLDFNLSKRVLPLRMSGMIERTSPRWKAPEQRADVDCLYAASDIFSCAAVYLFLASGKYPCDTVHDMVNLLGAPTRRTWAELELRYPDQLEEWVSFEVYVGTMPAPLGNLPQRCTGEELDTIRSMLHYEAMERPPAQVLLQSPWLKRVAARSDPESLQVVAPVGKSSRRK